MQQSESGTCRYLSFPKKKKRPFCAHFFLETTLFPLGLIEALKNSMSIHASPDGLWLRAGTALRSSQMRQRRCPGPCPARSAAYQMTRIRLVASQRWDPTLGCRRMKGVFKHLQTMNRKCLQTPNTRVPNCFWQHCVKLMGLSPSELLKNNVLHAEAFAGPMSLSTGQCHVAEVGSGKLELFHQAKMLRRFHVIISLVGTQGICTPFLPSAKM